MDTRLKDKDWRVNHLYKIQNKRERKVQFKRNRAQQHFNEHKWYRNIILKTRQLGFTTDEAIDSLDDTLFTRNRNSLFIAHTDKEAKKIFDTKIMFAWKNMEPAMKDWWKVDTSNANMLKYDFGDGTESAITVATSGRSGTFGRVHITEFAKLCNTFPIRAKEILSGTIPAVPIHGRIDIESTGEGDVGGFYDIFTEAWDRGEPKLPVQFKAHFYNWTWDDEGLALVKPLEFAEMEQRARFEEYAKQHNLNQRQITYYYYMWVSLNKNWETLHQEYPTTPQEAFLSTGNKFFSLEFMDEYAAQAKDGKIEGDWTIYQEYDYEHVYVMGADVAEGVGLDSSTAVIWAFNIQDTSQLPTIAAEFASNTIAADTFAFELKDKGNRYGTCMIGVERNNHGHATLNKLKEIYPARSIYTQEKFDEREQKKTVKLGWHTNAATKPMMMYDFKTALNGQLVEIPSKRLITEIRTYNKDDLNTTSTSDEATHHWDLLMAAAIGWQMRNHIIKPKSALRPRVPLREREKTGFGRIRH